MRRAVTDTGFLINAPPPEPETERKRNPAEIPTCARHDENVGGAGKRGGGLGEEADLPPCDLHVSSGGGLPGGIIVKEQRWI